MKKQLIFPKNKYWRKKNALCGILEEWYGKKDATKIICDITSQPVEIQTIIEKILARDSSDKVIELQRTKIAWEKIIPPEYKENTYPSYIKNNILYIKVKDSCSLMELKMQQKTLTEKLKKEICNPKFTKIHFLAC
ncbi:MAG TPA: DUF721 domain-containing protein [Victivallales bacterium]|nr:DUF721 domain-containing protein [Victivallales bacterium]